MDFLLTTPSVTLPAGTQVETFEINGILGVGGFGITYKAWDHRLERQVAVKEYLPGALAIRGDDSVSVLPRDTEKKDAYDYGLKRFLDEARTLARFNHPNIVRVLQFLEAHGTAYMVMDFEKGQPLAGHLKKLGAPMSEHAIMALARPLLDGLKAVHAEEFLHRDIKPDNIYLRAKGAPVLLDFGAARQAMGEHSGPLTAMVTPGYGPVEQYSSESEQGPWTDLYALGGTLYRCISGQVPVEATKRLADLARGPDPLPPAAEAGKGRYSEMLLAAIDWMLALLPEDRPQSVAEVLPYFTEKMPHEASTELREELLEKTKLRTELREKPQKTRIELLEQAPRAEPRRERKGVRLGWIALGALLIVGTALTITLLQERTSPIDTQVDSKAKLAQQIAPLLSSAREQLDRGNAPGALRSIVSALEVDPTDAEARVLADELLSNARSQVAKARQDAERARAPELAPKALEAARVKEIDGESLSRSGEIENAVQTLWAGAQLFDLAHEQAELELARQRGAKKAQGYLDIAAAIGPAAEKVASAHTRLAREKNAFEEAQRQQAAQEANRVAAVAPRDAITSPPSVEDELARAIATFKRGDYRDALSKLRPLAENHDILEAKYYVGFMYGTGKGVPRDDAEAVKWYRRAAEQGYDPAQNSLGVMYTKGRGVVRDDRAALEWYRRAAEQCNADAQTNIGNMYAQGRGTAQNDFQAYAWYEVAVAAGSEIAKELRDVIGKRLQSVELEHAIKLAQRYAQCKKAED